jgi:hypothetical protein
MEENNQNNDSQVVEEPKAQTAWEKFKAENNQPSTNVETVAQENNVQAQISSPEPEVTAITSSDLAGSSSEKQVLGSVADGVIGVTTVTNTPNNAPQPKSVETEKVAIYSTKNISIPGLGKVYRGYNIVKKDAADQWATKSYIRLATPDEVAKEFGK